MSLWGKAIASVAVGMAALLAALIAIDDPVEELTWGLTLAAAITFVLGLLLRFRTERPIAELTRVADELAAGKLDARTRADRDDELGRAGQAIDRMAEELRARIARLRAEEARLAAMLEGMVEAVFVTDATGRIVRTNRAFEALVSGPAGGRTVVEAIRSAELHEAVMRAREGSPEAVDLDVKLGAEVRTLSAQISPLPEKGGVVAVLHDVTDLKQADRVRRDFVANASHELRTPLTAIRGYAETLLDGALGDPATSERFVTTILRHTIRLQRLVDDLLALSRAESLELSMELGPVDVCEVAREAVSATEAQAQSKGIEVRIEIPDDLPPALASPWALDHVLVNLVDNAVKYTPEGGSVVVRSAADDHAVTVDVSDTGPGIPASSRERVFERFYRVDKGRSRDRGGTGLGLAIVKHLVSRMDGEITLDTAPGRGTTFRVRIPRVPGPRASQPENAEAGASDEERPAAED